MSLQLSIPDSILEAIRLPSKRVEKELLIELAIALYSQHLLSFGKARELARMGEYEFGELLGDRGINRHYGEELEDDLTYANSILLQKKSFPETTLDDVVGCLKYQGIPKTLEDMDDAIRQGVEESWHGRS